MTKKIANNKEKYVTRSIKANAATTRIIDRTKVKAFQPSSNWYMTKTSKGTN
jgi:hypothetical protein